MNVTVIGMGKIGLPLAVNFARNGASVTGLDNQVEVVDKINKGIPFLFPTGNISARGLVWE